MQRRDRLRGYTSNEIDEFVESLDDSEMLMRGVGSEFVVASA